jgi:hypothetical protein
MEIRPVGNESFHADRKTDRLTKLIVAFRNFAKAPKNELQERPLTVFDTQKWGNVIHNGVKQELMFIRQQYKWQLNWTSRYTYITLCHIL